MKTLEKLENFMEVIHNPVISYRGRVYPALSERFWWSVRKTDGCWFWEGYKNNQGYGVTNSLQRKILAHRLSFILHTNLPIPEGMFVCHHCDTPACVRPDHLFIGDQFDNIRDCVSKRRHRVFTKPDSVSRGSKVGGAKLTEEKVFQIRRMRLKGCSIKKISSWLKMDLGGMYRVLDGTTWAHVPFPRHEQDTFKEAMAGV